jgi:hypothetical protein
MRWIPLRNLGGDTIGVRSAVNCIGLGATGGESKSLIDG